MFIDANTRREDLLNAIYGNGDLLGHFCGRDMDPEFMSDDAIRSEIAVWIEAGDECGGC